MTEKLPTFLDSSLWVPAEHVPLDVLKDFTVMVKDDEGQDQNYNFYEYDYTTNYYKFSRGNLELIYNRFGHLGIEDRRVVVPMESTQVSTPNGFGIKFVQSLRPNQIEVVEKVMAQGGYGQIKAPPRFGKTVTMAYLTCQLQMKTLFLSHEISLSQQALDTFYWSTNVIDVEYALGKQVIGIVHEWEDLEKYDVCFMPYQKFVSGTDADIWLKKYKNRFGAVWVDESHIASRDWYSRIVGSFNSRFRMGVSGTTERKNNMHKVTNFTLGPVVVEGKSVQLPCEVTTVRTGIQIPFKKSQSNMKWWWGKVKSWLGQHEGRNDFIAKMIADYVQAGHSCIAVTGFSTQCEELAKILKTRYGIEAEAYHSKRFRHSNKEKSAALREACLDRLRTGKSQVMIGVRSMVLGLDIPRLTAFFNLIPTSDGPNYYQEYCRVRTPYEFDNGVLKSVGYLVDFVDEHFLLEGSYGSRKKLYDQEKFPVVEYKTSLW